MLKGGQGVLKHSYLQGLITLDSVITPRPEGASGKSDPAP